MWPSNLKLRATSLNRSLCCVVKVSSTSLSRGFIELGVFGCSSQRINAGVTAGGRAGAAGRVGQVREFHRLSRLSDVNPGQVDLSKIDENCKDIEQVHQMIQQAEAG